MLNASIVIYKPDMEQLTAALELLQQSKVVNHIYLVDNSPFPLLSQPILTDKLTYIFNHSNVGYGAAHNVAIERSIEQGADYHLVLNADVSYQVDDLETMLHYMDEHPQAGQLMPRVTYPDGQLQYLAKLLPTPMDLFARRFLPKRWIEKRQYRFELRKTGYDKRMNVPYLSGCFMLLRVEALRQVGLFDERFFMYPEDIDLTRRIHRQYQTVFFPDVTIIHDHAHASYRSKRMLWVHVVNICRYFNKYGWLRDPERDEINKKVETNPYLSD